MPRTVAGSTPERARRANRGGGNLAPAPPGPYRVTNAGSTGTLARD